MIIFGCVSCPARSYHMPVRQSLIGAYLSPLYMSQFITHPEVIRSVSRLTARLIWYRYDGQIVISYIFCNILIQICSSRYDTVWELYHVWCQIWQAMITAQNIWLISDIRSICSSRLQALTCCRTSSATYATSAIVGHYILIKASDEACWQH